MMIGALIGLLVGCILLYVGLRYRLKPRRMMQRCSAVTQGTVVGYRRTDDKRMETSDSALDNVHTGVMRPVSEYRAAGQTYQVTGPYYLCITEFHDQTSEADRGSFEIDGNKLRVYMATNRRGPIQFNPYEKLFPVGTQTQVHYDPASPSFAYVNFVPDQSEMGKYFALPGAACIVISAVLLCMQFI